MLLQTAKITSPPSQDCWPQIHQENGLILIVRVKADSPVLSRTIVSRFNDSYQRYDQEKTLARLEKSLKAIEAEFRQMRPEVISALFSGRVLYLGILNQGRAVLFREGKMATVLAGLPLQTGVMTASGFLKENDTLVFATEKFFHLLSFDSLKENLENFSLEKTGEVLNDLIQKQASSGVAGMIIKFKIKSASWSADWSDWRTKLSKIISRLPRRLKSRPLLRGWQLPRQQEPHTRQQKMMMTIAMILMVVLLTSVVLGWQKNRKAKAKTVFEEFWTEIDYRYREGKELIEINPVLARKLLQEGLDLIKQRKEKYAVKSWQYQRLEEKEKEIFQNLEKVLREYELSQVPVFLDLGLIKSGLQALDFSFWEEKMIVLGQDGTVLTIDFNKKTEIIGKIEDGQQVAFWGGKAFVLTEEGLVAVGADDRKAEKDWQKVVDLQVFSGNLYLLDKEQNQILKLTIAEEGFTSPSRWLAGTEEVDLSQAQALAIDGDIWILLADGRLLKFTRGAAQNFAFSGLPAAEEGLPAGETSISETTGFYTDDSLQKIYILDKSQRRVIVFEKNGEYDSQYLWSGISDVTHLVVSEKEKKMLLLSGSKIYELEIRN